MIYTPEERRAYVRGALSACLAVKTTTEVSMQVCKDLCIAPEELVEIADEANKPLCKDHLPFVPGVLGAAVKKVKKEPEYEDDPDYRPPDDGGYTNTKFRWDGKKLVAQRLKFKEAKK